VNSFFSSVAGSSLGSVFYINVWFTYFFFGCLVVNYQSLVIKKIYNFCTVVNYNLIELNEWISNEIDLFLDINFWFSEQEVMCAEMRDNRTRIGYVFGWLRSLKSIFIKKNPVQNYKYYCLSHSDRIVNNKRM
jgi:hypothetical protein